MSEKKQSKSKATKGLKLKTMHEVVQQAKKLLAPVTLKATADQKGWLSVEKPLASSKSMLSSAMGKNAYRTKLFYAASTDTGVSGNAYTTVIQANLALASEWNTFGALFDEVRAMRCKCSMIASIASGSSLVWTLLAFDENDNTALASISAGLSASFRSGPHRAISPGSTTPATPSGVLNTEFIEVHSPKLSRSAFPNESSGTPVAYPIRGDWVSAAASTAIVCFFKPYCEAVASNTWSVRYFIEWDVEYRMRS